MATSSAESRKDRSSLPHPDRQVASFDELRHDEAESVLGATHIEDRHDVGMVQLREDSGFNQKRLDILGSGDSLGVWHLDGDRAVEVVVVSQIDPSEPALTEPTDDPIAPNFGGISVRGRRSNSRLAVAEPAVPDRLRVSSEEPLKASAGA